MLKSKVLFFIVIFFFAGPLSQCFGQDLSIRGYGSKQPVGLFIYYFVDPKKGLSFQEIQSLQAQGKFTLSQKEIPNFGFSDARIWLYFEVDLTKAYGDSWLMEFAYPLIDHLHYYHQTGDHKFSSFKTGDSLLFTERAFLNKHFVFPFPNGELKKHRFFVSLEGRDTLEAPIYFWELEDFYRVDHNLQMIMGAYFGLMSVMMVYNLILFYLIRENVYLYYVAYILSFTAFTLTLTGYGFEYLWPNFPVWAKNSRPIFIGFNVIFIGLFTSDFLETEKKLPKLYKTMQILMVSALLSSVLGLFGFFKISITWAVLTAAPAAGIVFSTALYRFFQGYYPARLFIAGWSFFLIGIFVYCLKAVGILQPTFFVRYGMQLGTVIEVVLLATALAERINIMKKEREVAYVQLGKYNETLAAQVAVRTKNLNEALINIKDSFEYAKGIQSALLPSKAMMEETFSDYFVLWKPKEQVGGDIYLMEKFENGCLVALFDCTGHGVSGAMMTMIAKSGFSHAIHRGYQNNPALILKELNNYIKTALKQDHKATYIESDDGLEGGVCWFDFKAKKLTFAGARFPLVSIANGQMTFLQGDRQAVGYRRCDRDFDFTSHSLDLNSGDRFYLFSDGITEQAGGDKGLPFGKKRLNAILEANKGETLSYLHQVLLNEFFEYLGEESQRDDLSVVGMQV
ncbi:MAG: 7TM diverse intracellular signaling domain-containing protein [SAR324 cluster bacterium]|nr:7TM diverse intracellular signaling domain-containing protein [SAR324 cluster bacterium]